MNVDIYTYQLIYHYRDSFCSYMCQIEHMLLYNDYNLFVLVQGRRNVKNFGGDVLLQGVWMNRFYFYTWPTWWGPLTSSQAGMLEPGGHILTDQLTLSQSDYAHNITAPPWIFRPSYGPDKSLYVPAALWCPCDIA